MSSCTECKRTISLDTDKCQFCSNYCCICGKKSTVMILSSERVYFCQSFYKLYYL